jgi:hypothetical protein
MKKFNKGAIINCLAYVSLSIAFIIGFTSSHGLEALEDLDLLRDNGLSIDTHANENIYKVYKDGNEFAYLSVGKSQGYGGPMECVVISDMEGNIIGSEILKTLDTHAFINKLKNKGYYKQYEGKSVSDAFVLNDDIQAISGATVSSSAVSLASQEASHRIAEYIFHIKVEQQSKKWFLSKGLMILLVFLIGTFSIFFKKKKLRYFSQMLGLVLIGFMFNASLSLTDFARIILGYLPDIHTHLAWWILMGGTILVIIVFAKNVYCTSLCPFRASQILLNKISGINLKVPSRYTRIMSKMPMFLVWLSLMLIFISANPSLAAYEPFAILFSLQGVGVQWYILPCSLIGALFFSNFFCRFFCPVGGILTWIMKRRKQVVNLYNRAEVKPKFSPMMKDTHKTRMKEQKIDKEAMFGIALFIACLASILVFIIETY